MKTLTIEQIKLNLIEAIQLQIDEVVQANCLSGDITPNQLVNLESLTEQLATLVTEVVLQNL